jgi:hypothetical protein
VAPWGAGDEEFSLALWMKPTPGAFDGNWHGFIGYSEGGTRSPCLWINHAGTDCNPVCGGGPGGNNNGPLNDNGGSNDPDGLSQSGMHWDTRTRDNGDGTRFAGVIDGMFAVDTWINVFWTHTPGGKVSHQINGRPSTVFVPRPSGCRWSGG